MEKPRWMLLRLLDIDLGLARIKLILGESCVGWSKKKKLIFSLATNYRLIMYKYE